MEDFNQIIELIKKMPLSKYEVTERLRQDAIKQISGYYQREGWDKTFEWIKKQRATFHGSKFVGVELLSQIYNQVYSKMWKLTQK